MHWNSLRKLHPHLLQYRFDLQVDNLLAAGFPATVVVVVTEFIFKRVKILARRESVQPQRLKDMPEVMPYLHRILQTIMKVAGRNDRPPNLVHGTLQ